MIEIKKALWVSDVTKILIKLGGECNINCKHCHCDMEEFSFNEDVIRWIKLQPNLVDIIFNGGEPLLYFDVMKDIVAKLGDKYHYSMVSNGTLLNDEIVKWVNENKIRYAISFDGLMEHNGRDLSVPIRWDYARNLNRIYLASHASGNNNIFEHQKDAMRVKNLFHLDNMPNEDGVNLNFIHEVATAPGASKTMDDVKEYLRYYSHMIELQIIKIKMGRNPREMFALWRAVTNWLTKKDYSWGTQCSNQKKITVTLDGRFLRCPYTKDYYGDIYNGYDIDKCERNIPQKCKRCEIYEYCRNICVENTTAHECYIAKKMHKFLKQMEVKHSIDLTKTIAY